MVRNQHLASGADIVMFQYSKNNELIHEHFIFLFEKQAMLPGIAHR